MKLKNAESAIVFLQTQHAEILQGLHTEIQTLQEKCARKLPDAIFSLFLKEALVHVIVIQGILIIEKLSLLLVDLTFELAMKESSCQQQSMNLCYACITVPTILLFVGSDKRLQELKEQLKCANEEVMKLRSAVAIKEEASGLLEHQLREVEQKYAKQLATKESIIQKLQSELDTQSSSIAYLTMKLHQSKQKYRKAMEQLKTFYNSGYMIHGSDSFIEDDIKKLDRNPARAKTPPVFPVSSTSVTGNPRGSRSEPISYTKAVSRELPQLPVSPRPPSTPRNASTPSSGKVRRTLLRRSSSRTAPSPSNTTVNSSGELVSSSSSLSHSPVNPLQTHYNITDILETGTLNMEALKLGSSHPVLPPIQDGSHSPTDSFTNEDNSAQKFVKAQQLPSESFVGIQKIKNLSNARKTTASSGSKVTTAEPSSRVLVKEDTSRKAH